MRAPLGWHEGENMAESLLESGAVGAFCESVSTMLGAGAQVSEAVEALGQSGVDGALTQACAAMAANLADNRSLSVSMRATEVFPAYAVDTIAAAEASGNLADTLHELGTYYNRKGQLLSRLRGSATYFATALITLVVILLVSVSLVLPAFTRVYQSTASAFTDGAFRFVGLAGVLVWIALIATVLCVVAILFTASRVQSESGRSWVLKQLEKVPYVSPLVRQLGLSRFAKALEDHLTEGLSQKEALEAAAGTVTNAELVKELEKVQAAMSNEQEPLGLAEALAASGIFEPMASCELKVAERSGSLPQALERLSNTYGDEVFLQAENLMVKAEQILQGFVTITIGVTIIALTLPLMGIMGAIG